MAGKKSNNQFPTLGDSVVGVVGGSSRAATCKARFSKGKIGILLVNSMVIRANPPQFFTAILHFSLTVSLTVPELS